jgi:DNA mismatch repair protein MutS
MQAKMTPLMQQYWEIKAHHEDKVLLFRMGDFFEMFHQDAETAAPIVGIALTQRNKKDSDSAKMCGVPHHSIATPIAKLLAAGHKVAICDQIEDPAVAKGLVKRAVTRVLTPGMVYDPDTLDQLSANYLCSYDSNRIAFADVTTGEAFAYSMVDSKEREELIQLLQPAEIVLPEETYLQRKTAFQSGALISRLDHGADCIELLKAYIEKLQGPEILKGLAPFVLRQRHTRMRVSTTVLRHLEVFANARGEKQGSLFAAMNRTQTTSGARLLKSWLCSPLLDVNEIRERQTEVKMWIENPVTLKAFRQALGHLGDVERRLGKIHSTTFNARDLVAIAQSMDVGHSLYQIHPGKPQQSGVASAMQVAREILNVFNEELPISVKEGGLIRRGAHPELDELITLTQDSQKLLLELEGREREATGISSLKVRYNNVFGFYIELTKTHAHKAPDHYRRKQTLTNAERYTTDELDKLEEKVLAARSKRDQLEYEIYSSLRAKVVEQGLDWLQLSHQWTCWDVLSSLAWLALEQKYCCPEFGETLDLQLSRHPVVEQGLRHGFVPNTVQLNSGECLLLTGPNMAGKSTLMRQVALIAVMAQIGSMVPAQTARLPIFHQIFTRLGASDFVSEGLSTFMVEMSETSEILQQVSHQSLVIMDEIGRGTSTYDGLSLAQAILEHMVTQKKPYLLFATHYHELTGLGQIYPQLHNAHMTVLEKGGQVHFLHTLVKGPANRSYGIHVAKLAGIPPTVTERARQLLVGFEGQKGGQLSFADLSTTPVPSVADELPAWLEEMKSLNLSRMTPLDALNKLFEWQREASS